MLLSGIINESIVDGFGIRMVLFTQGCPHRCHNCHNQHTWSYEGGKYYEVGQIFELIDKLPKYICGITFSGGEPFLQAFELAQVANYARRKNLNITTYSGFTFSELLEKKDPDILALLSASDVLIDGKYIDSLKTLTKEFCGSQNQRIIDVQKSLKSNQIILYKGDNL